MIKWTFDTFVYARGMFRGKFIHDSILKTYTFGLEVQATVEYRCASGAFSTLVLKRPSVHPSSLPLTSDPSPMVAPNYKAR
jgi:hypothetical protein